MGHLRTLRWKAKRTLGGLLPPQKALEKKLEKKIVYHKVLTYLSAFHLLGMGTTYLWYGDNQCFVVLCGDVAHHIQILQHDCNWVFHIIGCFPSNGWSLKVQ